MEYQRIRYRPGDKQAVLINRIDDKVTIIKFVDTNKPLSFYELGELGVLYDANQSKGIIQAFTVMFPPIPTFIS